MQFSTTPSLIQTPPIHFQTVTPGTLLSMKVLCKTEVEVLPLWRETQKMGFMEDRTQ
jgi:hypothetical protein